MMNSPAARSPYAGYRFPAEVISQDVCLYFRFPLSLRMVEEMLAARGIVVSHELFGSGRSSSARSSPTGSGGDCPALETSGTLMRS
jgi:hypothetical protein